MSNIYRGQIIAEEQRVLDFNDRIASLMDELEIQLQEEKEERRTQAVMELLESLEPDADGNYFLPLDEDGTFTVPVDEDGEPLVDVDENGRLIPTDEQVDEDLEGGEEGEDLEEVPEEPQIDPEELARQIIADAEEQADGILASAESQAEQLRQSALEEGNRIGYSEGSQRAEEEMQERMQQLDDERAALEQEYEELRASLEGEVLETVCDVLEKAFLIRFGDDKDVLLQLVDRTMAKISSSKTFLIRVNAENFQLLNENREMLRDKVGSEAVLDIIKDPLIEPEKCLIETDGGVYDCGLDTQLKNLVKDIRMLCI